MESIGVKSKIKEVIGEMFEVNPADIPEDKPFMQMANYNSMRALEFLAKMEIAFDVTIDPEKLPNMTSVEKASQVMEEYLHAK